MQVNTARREIEKADKPELPHLLKHEGSKRRGSRALLLLFSAVLVSALLLRFAPAPFFWIGLTLAGLALGSMFLVRGSWARAVLFDVGVVMCLLAICEAYLVLHEYSPPVYPAGYPYLSDNALGWTLPKNAHIHATKPGPGSLLYGPQRSLFDVTYDTDLNGLRVAPAYSVTDLAGTILFFGCSFAFGEGLQDNETLPYQVGVQSNGRYRTFNFALGGYGAEQMLSALQHSMVARVVDTSPRYAYYVALPGHVARTAGKAPWGGHAPRYVLADDGTVIQDGYLENRKSLAERLGLTRGVRQLNKSAMWRILPMDEPKITNADMRLYLAVVRQSRQLMESQFPGIQFKILLWWNPAFSSDRSQYEEMQSGFRQMGIPFDLVENILPDYENNSLQYVLSSRDHHPNALANRLLAQHILGQLTP